MIIPSKVQSYIAAGKSIFMSELKQDELVKLGHKAKRYAQMKFDRDRLITQLENCFVDLEQKPKGLISNGKRS